MKYLTLLAISFLLFYQSVFPESLFDTAASENKGSNNLNYELNGHVLSNVYLNKDLDDLHSRLSEGALQLKVNKGAFGNAFAEIRIKNLNNVTETELREGYVNIYQGPFDFRIGNQIIVWGRADGYNPTDIINPKNILERSPDEDDKRLANFMIKADYNFAPFRLETVFIPYYLKSEIINPNLPTGVSLADTTYSNKSSKAVRLNHEGAGIDYSISYFEGYSAYPGISVVNLSLGQIGFQPYETQVVGADFSTTMGQFGVRGEIAYKKPKDYDDLEYAPYPELEAVFGIDKELINDVNLIFQYYGKHAYDWEKANVLNQFANINQIISRQTKETQHSVIYRVSWNLFHETLLLENLSQYNLTTEELFFRVKAEHDITDDLSFVTGYDSFWGPENTLGDFASDQLSAAYAEVKVSF